MKWINKITIGNFYIEQLFGQEEILLLTLNGNENKINDLFIQDFNKSLDYIENCNEATCLITTSSHQKYYSLGFDLKWVVPLGKDKFESTVHEFEKLLNRILVFPIPTVCSIVGHAYAGGAILTMAHDYRVMKDGYGYFTIPEIDHKIPMTPGSNKLLKSKINNSHTFRDVLFGKRFGGKEASNLQLVDIATKNVLEESVNLAQKLTKYGQDRLVYKSLKLEMYKNVSTALIINNLGSISINFSKL